MVPIEEKDMVYAEQQTRVVPLATIGLQTKLNFDNVKEIKKPESANSGLDNNSLDPDRSGKNGELDNPILPDVPNLYKHIGTPVENLGYFIIPRSVADDPRYQGARLKYQKVLFIILKHAAFAPTTHAIGVDVIPIAIGQFCIAERQLVELCNKGVKFKEDLVDRNIVTRAVQFWARCQYLSQQVIHGKTLLTLTIPEIYNREKTTSEPTSETKPSQNRANKEEDKELKEDNNISNVADAPDSAVAPSEKKKISSSSKKRKKAEPAPMIERDQGIFISDIAHQKLIEAKGSEEIVKQIYSAMAVWKAQNGISGGNDYLTAVRWTLTPAKPTSKYNAKPQPKYNHDTSPRNPKNSISFADEV